MEIAVKAGHPALLNAMPSTPEEALGPLIEHFSIGVGAEKGNKAELAREISRFTSSPVTRQMVNRWLDPSPARRADPRLTHGLALIHCGTEIMNRSKKIE